MKAITLYTFKNWNMIRYAFPYGIESDNLYTVWIDSEIHKEQIDKIDRVNPYLADIIKANGLGGVSIQFTLRFPERKNVRYGKLSI